MKVHISGSEEIRLLKRRLTLEGDELTALEGAEVVITDSELELANSLLIGRDLHVEGIALSALGFVEVADAKPDEWVAKFFNGKEGFLGQTLLTFPLRGLMNENLGPNIVSGVATRFVNDDKIERVFALEELNNLLRQLGYKGWVSIGLGGPDKGYCCMMTKLPAYALCNIMEGCPCGISDWMSGPGERLMESWTVGLLISRSPFPYRLRGERVSIGNITPQVEKHLWFYDDVEVFRRAYSTEGTKIGIATAWGDTLIEANRRALNTCRRIDCVDKQYRTDGDREWGRQWGRRE